MNEDAEAGGCDFPETPQPEASSVLRAAEPAWATPHPSQAMMEAYSRWKEKHEWSTQDGGKSMASQL